MVAKTYIFLEIEGLIHKLKSKLVHYLEHKKSKTYQPRSLETVKERGAFEGEMKENLLKSRNSLGKKRKRERERIPEGKVRELYLIS